MVLIVLIALIVVVIIVHLPLYGSRYIGDEAMWLNLVEVMVKRKVVLVITECGGQ